MKRHMTFFNTTPAMAHLIVGANIALEEKSGKAAAEAAAGLKTGLMGPFAGVGDTVFVAIYRAIVFSIAAYLALQGNAIGLLIILICAVAIWYVRYKFTMIGYNQGTKIASGVGSSLRSLTEGASILGLTVIGAMVPTTVRAAFANIKFEMQFDSSLDILEGGASNVVRNIQTDLLDKIMPFLVPLAIVFFAYWLLGKKKMTSTKLILVLFAIGFVLGNLANLINGTWSY